MKILITGATGLVGGELIKVLTPKGFDIYRLSRSAPESSNDIQWDPEKGFETDEAAKLEGLDIVVHLAGEGIAEGSWTDERKQRIKDSRVIGTRTLVSALAATKNPPKTFISASAVGYYGDRGNEIITEESGAGKGFLPEICLEWEAESAKAAEFGARVVIPRIGIVLAENGGALEKMLTPFKYGIGGTLGSGEQWMPWVAIDDLVDILLYSIENEKLSGAFNANSPNPVQNKDFTSILAGVLSRPAFIPVPSFGIKLIFGEMGSTLLLEGARIIPRKLEQMGFKFRFPDLETALKHVLEE